MQSCPIGIREKTFEEAPWGRMFRSAKEQFELRRGISREGRQTEERGGKRAKNPVGLAPQYILVGIRSVSHRPQHPGKIVREDTIVIAISLAM